tara:strand:+ start:309 stop:953 length:645 start_codon:yes stop_codon:yes gene_type:complete
MGIKVKICGISDERGVEASQDADFIGFVFFQKSPRFISALRAKELVKFCSKKQKKVGLFVNADIKIVEHISDYVGLDLVQLHGDETLEFIKELKSKINLPIIKAIRVKTSNDIENSKKYENYCDMILFDTKNEKNKVYGGSGISFDWSILKNYETKKDWILAGGLNIKNIKNAIKLTGAPVLDISSGVENELGVKCPKKIRDVIDYINQNEYLQ